jgi:hypothetical protein
MACHPRGRRRSPSTSRGPFRPPTARPRRVCRALGVVNDRSGEVVARGRSHAEISTGSTIPPTRRRGAAAPDPTLGGPGHRDLSARQPVVERAVPAPLLSRQRQPDQTDHRPISTHHRLARFDQRIGPPSQTPVRLAPKRRQIRGRANRHHIDKPPRANNKPRAEEAFDLTAAPATGCRRTTGPGAPRRPRRTSPRKPPSSRAARRSRGPPATVVRALVLVRCQWPPPCSPLPRRPDRPRHHREPSSCTAAAVPAPSDGGQHPTGRDRPPASGLKAATHPAATAPAAGTPPDEALPPWYVMPPPDGAVVSATTVNDVADDVRPALFVAVTGRPPLVVVGLLVAQM